MTQSVDVAKRRLIAAGWFFAAGSAVHLFDHLRRGQGSVSEELYWLGNLALILQVVVVTVVLMRHRSAPVVAMVGGVPLAIGFLVVHWLPEWSALSDPVWNIDSWTWFSLLASSLEIVGALAVSVAGFLVVRGAGISEQGRAAAS